MKSARSALLAAALGATVSAPLTAQEIHPELPDSVAERVVAFYNRDATTRLPNDAQIAAGTSIQGDVAVLGGTLIIEGTVTGYVIVINGNIEVRANGRVGGTVTVVGGDARVDSTAVVGGGTTVFREALRYRYEASELVYVPPHLERGLSAGVDLPFGRTDMLIASHGAYNRAEGLAIAGGPRLRFTGAHRTTVEALLIARTATTSELDAKRFGFELSAEGTILPRLGVTLGAQLYSVMEPIEPWALPDREAALATFLLHTDYRDEYEREGWRVFGRMARPGYPYTLTLEYRDEEHAAALPADPFTMFYRNDDWRPQALIAQGALRSVGAQFRYDTRNEQRDPSAGWLIDASIEQGLGGGLNIPLSNLPDGTMPPARSGFLATGVDIRRYARLTPYSRLGMRVVALGSLDARSLPPQRQHALGGEGTLPGYRIFEFDCGARRSTVTRGAQAYFPYYGCDRVGLVQLEYQASFPFGRKLGQVAGLGSLASLARWVAFFDAGRAWIEPDARRGRPGGNDDFSVDAGLGIRFGPLGAYWAVPLSAHSQGVNFFVRVGPRI